MLATLSFRIMEVADARTRCSLRLRPVMPGNGRMSRVHTSVSRASSLILSARGGANTVIRFVVRRDCDLFIETVDALSLNAFVFLIITWQRLVWGPTVVARWIEILLAMVPNDC